MTETTAWIKSMNPIQKTHHFEEGFLELWPGFIFDGRTRRPNRQPDRQTKVFDQHNREKRRKGEKNFSSTLINHQQSIIHQLSICLSDGQPIITTTTVHPSWRLHGLFSSFGVGRPSFCAPSGPFQRPRAFRFVFPPS